MDGRFPSFNGEWLSLGESSPWFDSLRIAEKRRLRGRLRYEEGAPLRAEGRPHKLTVKTDGRGWGSITSSSSEWSWTRASTSETDAFRSQGLHGLPRPRADRARGPSRAARDCKARRGDGRGASRVLPELVRERALLLPPRQLQSVDASLVAISKPPAERADSCATRCRRSSSRSTSTACNPERHVRHRGLRVAPRHESAVERRHPRRGAEDVRRVRRETIFGVAGRDQSDVVVCPPVT